MGILSAAGVGKLSSPEKNLATQKGAFKIRIHCSHCESIRF